MAVSAPTAAPALAASSSSSARVRSAFRVEWRKLTSQLVTRVLLLLCALGPFAFAAVLKLQSSTPSDTLFGVWVHSSGFALPLVILSFAGQWGFPAIAGIVAGDILSSEDRYGTWKTVLTRSRTRADLFAGKLLAASAVAVAVVAVTAVASIVAGLVVIGDQSLVGFGGKLIPPGRSLFLVAVSWSISLLPLLAFVALAVLFSAVTRNGILGVLGPLLVALAMQLLALIGNGTWLHTLLLASAFGAWHGLFAQPAFAAGLIAGCLVSVAWVLACLAGGWAAFARRDFAGVPAARRAGWRTSARVALGALAVLAVLTVATNWGAAAVTPQRLRDSFAPTFNHLTLLQQRLLGRRVASGARLNQLTACARRGGASGGPGDDWVCNVDVLIAQSGPTPLEQTVSYDVSVQSNGCYKADSPPSFVGSQLMRVPGEGSVVNPLFTIYGCFNTL
ncbi:MAG TPA: ABC transporter permease [Solirubrobacteraceae bacterium]